MLNGRTRAKVGGHQYSLRFAAKRTAPCVPSRGAVRSIVRSSACRQLIGQCASTIQLHVARGSIPPRSFPARFRDFSFPADRRRLDLLRRAVATGWRQARVSLNGVDDATFYQFGRLGPSKNSAIVASIGRPHARRVKVGSLGGNILSRIGEHCAIIFRYCIKASGCRTPPA